MQNLIRKIVAHENEHSNSSVTGMLRFVATTHHIHRLIDNSPSCKKRPVHPSSSLFQFQLSDLIQLFKESPISHLPSSQPSALPAVPERVQSPSSRPPSAVVRRPPCRRVRRPPSAVPAVPHVLLPVTSDPAAQQ